MRMNIEELVACIPMCFIGCDINGQTALGKVHGAAHAQLHQLVVSS